VGRTASELRNDCEIGPAIEPITEGAERWAWACPAGAEVALVAHDEGHRWRLLTTELDATEMLWEFFELHPMPE
jgi:poly(3-hydroxybutyrate) depolymerase